MEPALINGLECDLIVSSWYPNGPNRSESKILPRTVRHGRFRATTGQISWFSPHLDGGPTRNPERWGDVIEEATPHSRHRMEPRPPEAFAHDEEPQGQTGRVAKIESSEKSSIILPITLPGSHQYDGTLILAETGFNK
jgi:hypothetical protein